MAVFGAEDTTTPTETADVAVHLDRLVVHALADSVQAVEPATPTTESSESVAPNLVAPNLVAPDTSTTAPPTSTTTTSGTSTGG